MAYNLDEVVGLARVGPILAGQPEQKGASWIEVHVTKLNKGKLLAIGFYVETSLMVNAFMILPKQ